MPVAMGGGAPSRNRSSVASGGCATCACSRGVVITPMAVRLVIALFPARRNALPYYQPDGAQKSGGNRFHLIHVLGLEPVAVLRVQLAIIRQGPFSHFIQCQIG